MSIIQIPSSTGSQIVQTTTGMFSALAPVIYLVIGIIATFFVSSVLLGIVDDVFKNRKISAAVAMAQKAGYSITESTGGIKKPKEALELAHALKILKEAGFIITKKEVQ